MNVNAASRRMGPGRVYLLDAYLLDRVVSDVIEGGGTEVTRRLGASIR
jgi:hypothetical protein